MSSIVTLIESIVTDLSPAATFIHGTKGWQNIKADAPTSSIVFLDEPIFSNDTFHQGGLVDSSYPLRMIFMQQSKHENTPAQSRVFIDTMRELRRQFILRLKAKINTSNEKIFKEVKDVQTTDMINAREFDRYLTGCLVTFTAVPLNSDSICVS